MFETIFAGLLILALLGWALTVTLFARSILPLANAYKVANEIDARFDKRVTEILDRAKANATKVLVPDGKPTPQDTRDQIQSGLTNVFGEGPLISRDMFDEQPDPDTEVVRA